jgi:hypothetical protein
MLRWRRFLKTPGCAAVVILPLRSGSAEPSYSQRLSTAVLAHKHDPHSIEEWKKPLMVLASDTTGQLLSASRDWYEPPLKGISLGRVLASLGVVCAVQLSTSPIVTAKGEPLTEDLLTILHLLLNPPCILVSLLFVLNNLIQLLWGKLGRWA